MAGEGRARKRRAGGRGQRSSPRGPQRGARETHRSRLRRGLAATRASGAAKVLGLSSTRRAAILAIVVCALAFTIAVPLRTYLEQRAEVAAEEARQAELRREVAELEHRKAQLSDPSQVEAEARRRLRYVMPGETPYMVELPGDEPTTGTRRGQQRSAPSATWYEQLWDTVAGK